ncbi:MAG: exosortase/archaeosortase family protein, partial [Candidatus Lokiarchaeota archaeon]|nr:exosortase/archaeosortase family protein [Candidatus Lokiarchaeota archaeon]
IQVLLILNFVSNRIENRLKIGIVITHSMNLLFAIVIGFSISVMESDFKNNFGLVMIPLLVILSLVITDKYHNNLKDNNDIQEEIPVEKSTRPVIEFEDKKYIFSFNSLILLGVGTPILALVIYFFFDVEAQFWLHEVVVKQTVYFLNLFFDMDVSTSYIQSAKYHWSFNFNDNINGDPLGSIYFETFCTGIQAICVFAGIIICTPHSKDKSTNKDIIWRKTKALIVSSIIFYVVNVIRMLIQIELYYLGYPWDSIHVSISAASSFIAAIIILLLHKWIPEFIISIIYTGTLISNKIKLLRKPKEE